ncbi:MAG: hypothetical protein AAGF13_06340 [Pseudomonadota bacterium]
MTETFHPDHETLITTYLDLTRITLPALAPSRPWPVSADHCFQRIILDNVVGGVWYDHIPRPAYEHLSLDQARAAAKLALDIKQGTADLSALNDRSLAWRRLARQRAGHRSQPWPAEHPQKTLDL